MVDPLNSVSDSEGVAFLILLAVCSYTIVLIILLLRTCNFTYAMQVICVCLCIAEP